MPLVVALGRQAAATEAPRREGVGDDVAIRGEELRPEHLRGDGGGGRPLGCNVGSRVGGPKGTTGLARVV